MKTLIVLLLFIVSVSWAQEEPSGPARQRKFISLTIGIEQDEKLPVLPENIKIKGDFKKVTNASISRQIGVLRFNPKNEGVATLTIHDAQDRVLAEYRINVKKSKLDRVAYEIRSLLADIEGITIKIVNNRVVVDGQIILPKDLNRILSVIDQYGEQASSLVTVSPIALKKVAEYIARDINNPEIEVRAVNDYIILQGQVASGEEKDRALMVAKLYLPDMVKSTIMKTEQLKRRPAGDTLIDLITIKPAAPPPPSKMIQAVIHYVELEKSYGRSFRFQFTPGIANDQSNITFGQTAGGGGSSTTIAATIDNLFPKLNWAKSHGHARVLESSTITVEDHKKGEIKSVTNIPYHTTETSGQASTKFAQVGITTKLTPTLLGERSDSINMDLEFSVTSLVENTAAGPTTSNNSLDTSVIVRSNQSAAIGGLISNRNTTSYNRAPPGTNANPIISILSSKEFEKNASEFVVFVTPIIKSSASAGSDKIKRKFRLRD